MQVDVVSDKWENGSSGMLHVGVDSESKTLIGTITSVTAHGGYINQTTSFSMTEVLESNILFSSFKISLDVKYHSPCPSQSLLHKHSIILIKVTSPKDVSGTTFNKCVN